MSAASSLAVGHLPYRNSLTAATSGANAANTGKLWLPIWAGEIIHAYDEYNMFEPLINSRTISSGTTIEFPITGTVDLNPSWDAGEELVGGADSTATTFQVRLDKRPMAAHFEIDNVDLMLTQWEFRSELARQAAMTLANTRDKQLYSYLCRAAVTTQTTIDKNNVRGDMNLDTALYGETATSTRKLREWGATGAAADDRSTGALSALEAVEKYIVFLQENNIPYDQLYMAISPQCFMDIRSLGVARVAADMDTGGRQAYFGGNTNGGNATGLGDHYTNGYRQIHDSLEYMGCTIVKTNHGSDQLRNTDGGNTLGEDKYNLDFAADLAGSDTTGLINGVRALMWTPEAIAGIRLQGLKVDTVDDVRRNTTFSVASMMSGTGVLKPECAAIIHTRNGTSGSDYDTRSEMAGQMKVDADGYVDSTGTGV